MEDNKIVLKKHPFYELTIDAKLLKRIVLKDLEPENIQNADAQPRLLGSCHRFVHTRDNPVEKRRVDKFGESVAGLEGLGNGIIP